MSNPELTGAGRVFRFFTSLRSVQNDKAVVRLTLPIAVFHNG